MISEKDNISYQDFKYILKKIKAWRRFHHTRGFSTREKYTHPLFDLTIESTMDKLSLVDYKVTDRWQKHGGIISEELDNFSDAVDWINSILSE